jgi:hypothetical protein
LNKFKHLPEHTVPCHFAQGSVAKRTAVNLAGKHWVLGEIWMGRWACRDGFKWQALPVLRTTVLFAVPRFGLAGLFLNWSASVRPVAAHLAW